MKKLYVHLLRAKYIVARIYPGRGINQSLMICFTLACTSFLAACSSHSGDYLQAKSLPPISVPEGLDKQKLGQIYQVPESDGRIASDEFKKPLPPTLASREQLSAPTIQQFDEQVWLTVPNEASVVWTQLVSFLQQRQIPIVKQDLSQAMIETGWFTQAAQPGLAHRYRLQLESALQSGATEIHAQNIQGPINAEQTIWPEEQASVSQSPAHERWLLDQLSKNMTADRVVGDSLLASGISLPEKVRTINDRMEPVLEFTVAANRVYRALENALTDEDQENFVLYEKSDADQVFYINEAVEEGKKKPFLKKLDNFLTKISTAKIVGGKLVASGAAAPYSLDDILTHLPQEEPVLALFPASDKLAKQKKLSGVKGYLLVQRKVDNNKSRVYIRDGYGRLLSSSEARGLLETIKRQLL